MLVLINVATIFPLWPGNFGLVQIAVALPLVNYGVAYAHGVAFGDRPAGDRGVASASASASSSSRAKGCRTRRCSDMDDRDEDIARGRDASGA